MKKICFGLMMVLVMCSAAFAEIQQFQKDVSISAYNSTLHLKAENLDKSYILTIINNSISSADFSQTISFYQNVSCTQEQDYSTIVSKINDMSLCLKNNTEVFNGFVSSSMSYYDKYTQCYAQLTACTEYKAEGYKEKLDESQKQVTNLQMVLASATVEQARVNASCAQTVKDLNTTTSQRNGLAVITLALLGGVVYMFIKYVRKQDKLRQSPIEKSDSRGITGI